MELESDATQKCFVLESSEALPKASQIKGDIRVYRLDNRQFRLIFVPVPGPLVNASLILPTLASDNKGLPHTLEHLVFCGSQSLPFRGYLDNLATRCLSTGTNAYTAEDHTSYEICTAGPEGMLNIFPVFLDHVLNPTLRDRQFMTEVYHLDGSAKKQGVVFCEVFDLLSRHISLSIAIFISAFEKRWQAGKIRKVIYWIMHFGNCYLMVKQLTPSNAGVLLKTLQGLLTTRSRLIILNFTTWIT